MKTRIPIPSASILHKLFTYRKGVLYWKHDIRRTKAGDVAGYLDGQGYITVGIAGVYYKAHRLVWRMHHPKGKMPKILDHADRVRSNNKIENLRIATHGVNMCNRGPAPPVKLNHPNKLTVFLGEENE